VRWCSRRASNSICPQPSIEAAAQVESSVSSSVALETSMESASGYHHTDLRGHGPPYKYMNATTNEKHKTWARMPTIITSDLPGLISIVFLFLQYLMSLGSPMPVLFAIPLEDSPREIIHGIPQGTPRDDPPEDPPWGILRVNPESENQHFQCFGVKPSRIAAGGRIITTITHCSPTRRLAKKGERSCRTKIPPASPYQASEYGY
jgi:hypothetical protein